MSLLLLFPQGQAATTLDAEDIITDLVPLLNGKTLAGLSIVSETEIFEFTTEALQRLARSIGGFVVRDATLTITGGTSEVTAPTRHLSSIHASYDSDGAGAWKPIPATTVAELEALDTDWETVAGTPEKFTHDQLGHDQLRVYKTPASNTGLALIYHEEKAALSSGSSTFSAPKPIQDYLLYHAIGEIRGQENDEAMPEVSRYAKGRADVYLSVFEQYWGRAQ